MTDQAPGGRPPAGPSRRALLATVAGGVPLAVVLTACEGVQVLGTPPPPPRDVRVLRAAIAAEEHMVTTYTSAIAGLPAGKAGVIAAVRTVQAEHAAHLAELRSRLIEPAGPSRRPAATPPATAPPGGLTSLLQSLEQAEQAASDRLIGQLDGLPPALAQLFASIAAAEATHVPFLRRVAR